MVCATCFIVPALLYLWHKFLQSYVLRFWNPSDVEDTNDNNKSQLELNFEGGVYASRRKPVENKNQLENSDDETNDCYIVRTTQEELIEQDDSIDGMWKKIKSMELSKQHKLLVESRSLVVSEKIGGMMK